jgi:hypothetical protein
MQTIPPFTHADILVKSPDAEYLLLVEVKTKDTPRVVNEAIASLKHEMTSFSCSLGLLVAGERVILLRDSLAEYNGTSIYIVGEARLPKNLLPSADPQWQEHEGIEFESMVQNWLESLKLKSNFDKLPEDLKNLLSEPIIYLLKWGEISAAGYRWSKAAK